MMTNEEREALITALAQSYTEDMDIKTMLEIIYESFYEELEDYPDMELIKEAAENYPELIKNEQES